MDRNITVKGVGRLSVSPDTIEISLTLRSKDKDYAAAMEASSKQLGALGDAAAALGFNREELKTTSFNVRTEYESMRDANGVFRQVFAGYVCEHMLVLRFPFDTEKLSLVLTAFSNCLAEPELYVSFTVKDREALKDGLLASAAKDARRIAELLAEASGAQLGQLVKIEHGAADHDFVSPTRFTTNAKMAMRGEGAAVMMDNISAEDIKLTEEALFMWELV